MYLILHVLKTKSKLLCYKIKQPLMGILPFACDVCGAFNSWFQFLQFVKVLLFRRVLRRLQDVMLILTMLYLGLWLLCFQMLVQRLNSELRITRKAKP